MAVVGRVARAHGRRGEVIVDPETDFPEARFQVGNAVFAIVGERSVEFRVASARFHRGRAVLGFESVATIDEAERLAGAELHVPESMLTPLPQDTFYVHDLVGCDVRTLDGTPVGTVTEIQRAVGVSRLIIGAARGEIDVPLVDAICVRVDTSSRSIVIDPPEGLLELNQHSRGSERREV